MTIYNGINWNTLNSNWEPVSFISSPINQLKLTRDNERYMLTFNLDDINYKNLLREDYLLDDIYKYVIKDTTHIPLHITLHDKVRIIGFFPAHHYGEDLVSYVYDETGEEGETFKSYYKLCTNISNNYLTNAPILTLVDMKGSNYAKILSFLYLFKSDLTYLIFNTHGCPNGSTILSNTNKSKLTTDSLNYVFERVFDDIVVISPMGYSPDIFCGHKNTDIVYPRHVYDYNKNIIFWCGDLTTSPRLCYDNLNDWYTEISYYISQQYTSRLDIINQYNKKTVELQTQKDKLLLLLCHNIIFYFDLYNIMEKQNDHNPIPIDIIMDIMCRHG
jgi:hypothetical protein